MQAYAEGFSLFDACEYELDNAKIAHLWMQGSVVRSWLCELAALAFEQEGNDLARLEPYVEDSGEGRWTVEDSIDKRIADAGDHHVAVRALLLARAERVRREGERRAAQPVRRPRGEVAATDGHRRAAQPARPRASSGCRSTRPRSRSSGPSGDLAKRKLLPAHLQPRPRGRAARALQPDRLLARRDDRRRVPRRSRRESIQEFSRRETDAKVLDALLENVRYVTGSFDDDSVYEQLAKVNDEFDEEAGITFNRAYYLSTSPAFFSVIVGKLGEHGLDSHEDSEVRVVIEKPIGTQPGRGPGAQQGRARRARGGPGLPDRPLPGQGDGPEHAGVPVRQRPVRADLEPQLHRLRADHRGRGHRDRHAAPATTTPRARCATWCRTTCSSCSACCAWSRR